MTTNDFNPEIINSNLNSVQYYLDNDGSLKFTAPALSSSNFDGMIPAVEDTINAEDLKSGMLLEVIDNVYYPVVSLAYDDPVFDTTPTNIITVGYIDSNNELNTIDYNLTDSVNVRYEDWDNKTLGNQGWTITSGGNAVFANVGVRGDLEATTLDVGGETGITYDGTSVVIGASVVINAPVTFNGSGSFVTFNDLSASYALQSYVDDLNDEISASLQDLFITTDTLSASIDFLYDAGFVTDTDLVTNGATIINGNNITTGTIDANQVNISSGLTGLRGIKVNSLGLTAYNSSGTQTFNINSNTGVVTIGAVTADQLATDSELSSGLGGKINNGGAATDVNSNTTTISGGKIRTGSIESTTYSYTSGLYSNNGMQINLDNAGYIRSPNFHLDTSGNAYLRGTINAAAGFFGTDAANWKIGSITGGNRMAIETDTLKLYTQTSSGIDHGNISFFNTDGVTLTGTIANALSQTDKTILGLGNGLFIGTLDDYIFIPGSGNANKARNKSSGFEWYAADGTTKIMSIAGGTGGLRVQNNTGGVQVTGGGNITVSDGGKFVGDGSGLTNLPGGGGGGVTSFKFGDTGATETGAVAITGAEIITAINANSIGNGKLANSTIQIMSTTKSLGQSFVAGDIDGDVITANTLPPGKINNGTNLISIGTTGIPARSTINSINGLSTLQVTGAQGLDYTFNLGTTQINLNRSQQALGATLGGVNISGSAAQLNNTTSLIGTTWGAQGGVIYNNNGILAGIGTGTTGQFLRSNGTTAPSWQTIDSMTNPMTAVGDLIYGGTVDIAGKATPTRIAVGGTGAILRVSGGIPSWLTRGATAGQFLRVNSGNTDIGWETVSFLSNPMTTAGDIIYGGTNGSPTRLPAGSNGQFLQYSTTNNRPTWVTFSSLANPMTAAGQMIYGSTSGTPAAVAAGSSGQVLVSGGAGAPSFTSTLSGITLNPTISIGITGNASTGNVLVKAGSGAMLLGGTNIGSTIKIKENIQDLVNYESIYNLNPVTFYLKKEHQLSSAIETASVQIGFIAEEIAKILPEAVQYYPDSNEIWNYSDRAILAVAVKAIQEQKNIIDSLQNKLLDLEARLDAAGL